MSNIDLQKNFDLLIAMTEREIKARYKLAILGFLWIVLNPVLQMLVIGGVFSFIFKVPIQEYFAFLFTGLLGWNYFSATLLKVTPAITFELNLIEKAKFPREVIVLSIILSNLFHTLIAFGLFAIVLLVIGRLEITRLPVLILPIFFLTMAVTGLGFLTSALNVRFRDVNFFVQALVPLWLYATPVLYNVSLVPEKFRIILFLNPLSSVIEMLRWVLVRGEWPATNIVVCNVTIICVLFIVGTVIFRREAKFFDDWV